jgi:hypothetical protein
MIFENFFLTNNVFFNQVYNAVCMFFEKPQLVEHCDFSYMSPNAREEEAVWEQTTIDGHGSCSVNSKLAGYEPKVECGLDKDPLMVLTTSALFGFALYQAVSKTANYIGKKTFIDAEKIRIKTSI